MATASPAQGLQGPLQFAKKLTGWYIAAAVVFIVFGIFAILEPAVAGLGVTLLVGWLLVFGGVMHLITAFRGGGAKQVLSQVLIGILYLVCGIYFLMHPLLGISALTLFLSAVFLAEGVLELVAYFRMKNEAASGWLLLNGIVTLLLGGLIWFQWPSSSIWAIGILVGVNLLMTGSTRLMFGLAVRKLAASASP